MAFKRAGFRRIVVDRIEYLWKFSQRRDHREPDCLGGCHAMVCRLDHRGCALSVRSPQHHPSVAPGLFPTVPVRPSQIADAIRRAVAAGQRPDLPGGWFVINGVPHDAEPDAGVT